MLRIGELNRRVGVSEHLLLTWAELDASRHTVITTPGWLAPGVHWLLPLALVGGAPFIPPVFSP